MMDFEQYGMEWNLKNWPFDHIIRFSPYISTKLTINFHVHI
jgi:hypothetical protein